MSISKPAFVLVHGAWHGGWCWTRVTPLLEAAGHRAFAVTLTGLGDRAHLSAPSVDLETHITDVVSMLDMDDLNDVVLVGHSYGGMVVSGAAERAWKRIRRLVYLDALVPKHGQSAFDLIQPSTLDPGAESSNTVCTGGLPEKPSSFQRATTCS